jgi:hypothetical protein
LPYLAEKIRATNLQPEVQAFLLWKLIGVSRDILANNQREHYMGVVDALMNGISHFYFYCYFIDFKNNRDTTSTTKRGI